MATTKAQPRIGPRPTRVDCDPQCGYQIRYNIFRARGYPLRSKKLKGARIVDGVRYTFDGAGYLRGTKDGRRVYLHRLMWEKVNGPIPQGFQLHFIDNDKDHCVLENLELVALERLSRVFNPTGRNQFSL